MTVEDGGTIAPDAGVEADGPQGVEPGAATDAVDSSAAEGSAAEQAAQLLDLNQYGDHVVTVKVAGEEQQVPLKEALEGHMRQADYTRKTQELASQKQRLARVDALEAALANDPQATLQALAEAYEVKFGPQGTDDSEEFVDPEEARIAKVEQWMAQQEERARQEAIDREIAGLKDRYGEFDENELFSHAIQQGIPNLEAAFAHMTYEKVRGQAQQDDAEQRQSEEQAAEQAKREAAVVSGGSNPSAGSTTGAKSEVRSIRDAWRLARQQLGN